MNSKVLAVLAVVVFLASGAVAYAAAPSEAEGEISLGTVYVDAGGSEASKVMLKFNEGSYTGYAGYEFTLKAGIGNATNLFYGKGSSNDENNTTGASFVVGDGVDNTDKITIKAEKSTAGVYYVSVTAGSSVETGSYIIAIDLDVTTHPVDGTNVQLDTVEYVMTVYVTKDSKNITFTYGDVTLYTNDSLNVKLTEIEPGSGIDLKSYEWYAQNLPKGLLVDYRTDGLYLVGLTTEAVSDKTIHVVGRDNNGNEVYGTFDLTISEMPDVNYNIKPSDGGDPLSHTGDSWVVKTGSDSDYVVLTIEDDKGSYSVYVIDKDNSSMDRVPVPESTDSLNDGRQYHVPIDGVGSYVIEIVYDGGTKIVNLHIVPDATGSGAGFTVIGGQ